MGFSPGDFTTIEKEALHWELKSENRVVLWNRGESKKLLDLSEEQARAAFSQLETLIMIMDEK